MLIILGICTGSSANAQKNISFSRETICDFNISDLNILKENIRTDSVRAKQNQVPIFALHTKTYKDGGSKNMWDYFIMYMRYMK